MSVNPPRVSLSTLLRSPWLWLILLSSLFVIIQLLVGVQYGDAPRNLHWAMLVTEQPDFLTGSLDSYDMTDGFVPDPPELAPMGEARTQGSAFHPWWGPIPVLLISGVWWLTRSRELMALVVPISAGATVLACYGLGLRIFDRRTALVAAVFTALFPLFYEHAVISYSEAISALFLLLSLWAYIGGQLALTLLFGSVAVLCKIDIAFIYLGVIGFNLLYRLRYQRTLTSLSYSLAALAVPLLVFAAWSWLRMGDAPVSKVGGGFSLAAFLYLAPDMLQLLFYIPWYGALFILAIIGVCVVSGLRSPRLNAEVRLMLVSWLGLGLLVLLVYATNPRASNSPRIFLPNLPCLALLFAEGWSRLPRQWGRRVALYIGLLFIVINGVITYYHVEQSRYMHTFRAVWQVLREQPQGFVMTSGYWTTLWQTRQPVTWFEGDEQFQQNILHNRDNFERYTGQHPIRYVVVPRPGTAAAVSNPLIQVDTEQLYGDDVLQYLQRAARRIEAPPYDVYVLP